MINSAKLQKNAWSLKMFTVTYDIVTTESADQNDYDECGFIAENVSLREAVAYLFETRTSYVAGIQCIEANCSDPGQARWVSVFNGMEYATGDYETRSLHFPESITSSTRARICALVAK
jgi:hypothetical protein